MDQVRIGKFIAKCRKESGLTQMQLAEMLNITDRAVSKWETGKAMPDSSIMLELCGILNITVNDLLSGEVITMDDYKVNSEKLLLEMAKQKQEADKKLLALEILIGVLSMIVLLGACAVAAYVPMANWLMGCIIAAGFIVFVVGLVFAIRIEQTAGYYECAKCGHRYVPGFWSVLFAMHVNRTRFMKCPECHRYSWNKKVLSKDKNKE